MLPLLLGLGMAGAGAFRSIQGNKRAQEVEDQTRKMHVAQVKNSPWTGRSSFTPIQYAPGSSDLVAGLEGGLQGGASGLAMGQSLSSMGGGGAKPPAPGASGPLVSQNYADAFGQQDQAPMAPNMYQKKPNPWALMQNQNQEPLV